MRGWRQCVVGGLAIAMVSTACTSSSSGGPSRSVTIEQLRKATDTCPLPLDDAVDDAARPSGAVSATTVAPGSQSPSVAVVATPSVGTVLADIGGVSVECTVGAGAGTVTVLLIAATKPTAHAATLTLLPDVAERAGLSRSALSAVARRVPKTMPGQLVPLGAGATAALGVVTVGGARSAAFELHGEGVPAAVVRLIGSNLADRMG